MEKKEEFSTRPAASPARPQAEAQSARLQREHRGALRKAMHRRMYPNGVDLLAVVGILLLSGVLAGVVVALLARFVAWEPELITLVGYVFQMGLSIACVAYQQRARHVTSSLWRSKGHRVSAPLILWGCVLIFVTGIVIEPLHDLFPSAYLDFVNQSIGTGGWSILMTVVLAPILEETLFRGMLQGAITERDGATRGILLSALLFGIIHINPAQVVGACISGFFFAWLYARTRSILPGILIHILNNGLSVYLMRAYPEVETAGELLGSTGYAVLLAVSAVVLILSMAWLLRRQNHFKPEEL